MNSKQKEVLQAQLNREKRTIAELKRVYAQASRDCDAKIRYLSEREDLENIQSIIYQKQYQEILKKQLDDVLNQLHTNEFTTIEDYLTNCYTDGFIGNMYDLAGQGIPILAPIDQKEILKALQTDSKLSKGLYNRLGEDVSKLKTNIRAQLSRGIANGSTWNEMATQIAKGMKSHYNTAYNNAIRITRTEGHRVQIESAYDAQQKAKQKGADVVKQWDSTLDKNTRKSHRLVDGEIRELDEAFSNGLMFPSDPNGSASEVINCRCALLQRAKWALDEEELKTLQNRAKYYGLDKSKNFDAFKEKYLNASKEEVKKMAKANSGAENDWSKTKGMPISQKEKDKIIEYAKEKDVKIGDISGFDGDIDLLKAQIDAVSKTANNFPKIKNKITISVKDNLDDSDFAITRNKTITFNSKALRNKKITLQNILADGSFASKSVEDIGIHETGHIIENVYGKNALDKAKKAYYNVFNKELSDGEMLNYLKNNVSKYSTTYEGNLFDDMQKGHVKSSKYCEITSEILVVDNTNSTEFTKEFIRIVKGG